MMTVCVAVCAGVQEFAGVCTGGFMLVDVGVFVFVVCAGFLPFPWHRKSWKLRRLAKVENHRNHRKSRKQRRYTGVKCHTSVNRNYKKRYEK